VLFLEPVGGIAGDMFLAACIDLGLSVDALAQALRPLAVSGWHFEVKPSERHSIRGTHLDVVLDPPDPAHDRLWRDVRALIEKSPLAEGIKRKALATFGALARAEAHVHGTEIDSVHFHEVGAIDSIVDIVGAACALELLGDPEVFAAPPPLGSGTARSRHGVIPVPGPATLELLRDRPVRFEGIGELTTPTGAALLAALTRPGPPPSMLPKKIGFGVGTKDFADRPNVLRATLGERVESAGTHTHAGSSELQVLEANLDDMSPQLFGRLFERLLESGALDVWAVPVLMKKGRPGQLLGVLAESARSDALRRILFEESTTLGVRSHSVERTALERNWVEVQTSYGPVRIKEGHLDGRTLNASPEYEDAAARAHEKNVPVKEVIAAAIAAYRAGRSSRS
jgi:uncharacterized protein (TIGR00299 family) protein